MQLQRGTRFLAVVLLVLAVGLAGCGQTSDPQGTRKSPDRAYEVQASPVTRVVAVGDIACPPGSTTTSTQCREAEVADLTRKLNPAMVLGLGDLQYQRGTLSDFRSSYDASWGDLLPITRPVPGNHEYRTRGASGYYSYFKGRQPGAPGYYRVRTNGWNLYLLNSNCDKVSCSREARWLEAQMRRYPAKCTAIAMHHPRYSSGSEHGNALSVRGLWKVAYRHRTDIALAGHDHDYERFKRMNPYGAVRLGKGIQSFVSGAGGRSLYKLGTRKRGSVYFQARTPGVLRLDLRRGSYTWAFHAVNGRILDSGTRSCH